MMNDKTDPRSEWGSMDGPAQFDAIIGSIYTAGKTWRRNGWAFAGLVQNRDNVETIAADAWPLVPDLSGRCDSLGVALYRAVTTVAQRLYRQEMAWRGRIVSAQMEDDDGTWLYSNRLRIDLDQHLYDWLNMIEQAGFRLEK